MALNQNALLTYLHFHVPPLNIHRSHACAFVASDSLETHAIISCFENLQLCQPCDHMCCFVFNDNSELQRRRHTAKSTKLRPDGKYWQQLLFNLVQKQVFRSSLSAEMYAGRVACFPRVSHGEHADGTDGRTPDRYITLSSRRGQRVKFWYPCTPRDFNSLWK